MLLGGTYDDQHETRLGRMPGVIVQQRIEMAHEQRSEFLREFCRAPHHGSAKDAKSLRIEELIMNANGTKCAIPHDGQPPRVPKAYWV